MFSTAQFFMNILLRNSYPCLSSNFTNTNSVNKKPTNSFSLLPSLPNDLQKAIFDFVGPRQPHVLKSLCHRMKDQGCFCAPLCTLISNKFSEIVLKYSPSEFNEIIDFMGRVNTLTLNTFYYDKASQRIITGDFSDYSSTKAIKVWDSKGKLHFSVNFSDFTKSVLAVKEIDGKIYAFSRREFGIWNAENGKTLTPLTSTYADMDQYHFSPSGLFFTLGSKIGYTNYEDMALSKSDVPQWLPNTHASAIAWIEEDQEGFLLTGDWTGNINIWNEKREAIHSIQTGEKRAKYLYIPSEKLIVCSLTECSIGVWDIRNSQLIKTLEINHALASESLGLQALQWDEKSKSIFASLEFVAKDNKHFTVLSSWDLESGTQLSSFPLKSQSDLYYPVQQIELEKSGKLILTAGYGVQIWSKKGKLLWKRDVLKKIARLEWDQSSKKLLVLNQSVSDHTYGMFDLSIINYDDSKAETLEEKKIQEISE